MSKRVMVSLIVAAVLILAGGIMFCVVMTTMDWDFTKLSTFKYEKNTYLLSGQFDDIEIDVITTDVVFLSSNDNVCQVVCEELENVKHDVQVIDGKLSIKVVDTRKWYDHIGIYMKQPKITISMPSGEYGMLTVDSNTGSVQIPNVYHFESMHISGNTGTVRNKASTTGAIQVKISTGNIYMDNISAGSVDLSTTTGAVHVSNIACSGSMQVHVSTGKANIKNVQCIDLTSDGSTGDLNMSNVTATGKISLKRSTGDIDFDCMDAAELYIVAGTGDIEGTLLSDKVFIASADTGDVDVPKTTTGGKCEVKTSTGDIKIRIS